VHFPAALWTRPHAVRSPTPAATLCDKLAAAPPAAALRGSAAAAAAAPPPPPPPPQPLLLWDPAAPFCPDCGSLLLHPDAGDVLCDACPFARPLRDFPHAVARTQSFPKPAAEWLVEWSVQRAAARGEVAAEDVGAAVLKAAGKAAAKRAVVDEPCPKCKAPTMEYWTAQLRSADEGQTVFYACVGCGHSHSVNPERGRLLRGARPPPPSFPSLPWENQRATKKTRRRRRPTPTPPHNPGAFFKSPTRRCSA